MSYNYLKGILRPLFGRYWQRMNRLRWFLVAWFYRKLVLPRLVKRIRRKGRIEVVFLPITVAMWRYDDVYRRMRSDGRFHPVIVPAPKSRLQSELKRQDYEEMMTYFRWKGYEVRPSYDIQSNESIDLRIMNPDIIFYTQPAINQVDCGLNCWHMMWRSLIAYAPYSYQVTREDWEYNLFLHNISWRFYLVSEKQRGDCREVSYFKDVNVSVVGYCLLEELAKVREEGERCAWRNDRTGRKRVIWAPHHSISEHEIYRMSSFLEYADFMLRLKEEYKDKILFAFKPHPFLYQKLCNIWGVERANAYYNAWRDGENSFLADSEYVDLFVGSDAMIHCSSSFMVEYLYTKKPTMYIWSKTRNIPDEGEFGREVFAAHYIAHSDADIRGFLEGVVLGGGDDLRLSRDDFYKKHLAPPNDGSFSENVIADISNSLLDVKI